VQIYSKPQDRAWLCSFQRLISERVNGACLIVDPAALQDKYGLMGYEGDTSHLLGAQKDKKWRWIVRLQRGVGFSISTGSNLLEGGQYLLAILLETPRHLFHYLSQLIQGTGIAGDNGKHDIAG